MSEPQLTARERQVYDALANEPRRPHRIARLAGITTSSPAETAASFCIKLVAKGLAEKCGTRRLPSWRRLPTPPVAPNLAQGGETP